MRPRCRSSRRGSPLPVSRSPAGRTASSRPSTGRRRSSTTTRCRASYAIAPDGRAACCSEPSGPCDGSTCRRRTAGGSPCPVAWSVILTSGRRVAVAALSDGTVRWYRMEDGKEIISYFPHGNGLGLDGLDARRLLHLLGQWRQLRRLAPQPRQGPHAAISIAQSSSTASSTGPMSSPGIPPARPPARARRAGGRCDVHIDQLRRIAPPRRLVAPPSLAAGARAVRVRLRSRRERTRGSADQGYAVFVNGIPVTPSRERVLSGRPARLRARSRSICRQGERRYGSRLNGVSMGTAETYIGVTATAAGPCRATSTCSLWA